MVQRPGSATFSFVNHTNDIINVSLDSSSSLAFASTAPGVVAAFGQLPATSKPTVTLSTYAKDSDSWVSQSLQLRKRILGKRKWEVLRSDGYPWRVYRVQLHKEHQRIVALPSRSLESWMSLLPDTVSLAHVCLPGTHETMALYGWPFSQCQDVTLAEQLVSGIRVLDIRIVLYKGDLMAFHGATPERTNFTSILEDVCAFIQSPAGQSETVVMSIMEEDSFVPSSPLFSGLVRNAILSQPSRRELWYLENRVPTLGEVRGKIVLFSRFGKNGEGWEGGLNGIGIHPPIWPNSRREGFEWSLAKTRVRTQDWYAIPSFLSIPEKFKVAVEMLHPKPAPDGKEDLAITFLSAANIPFALPSTVACGFGWSKFLFGVEGVNSRVGRWLLWQLVGDGEDSRELARPPLSSQLTFVSSSSGCRSSNKEKPKPDVRLRGWVLMDFIRDPFDLALVPLLIECNWRGRVEGEEGWIQ